VPSQRLKTVPLLLVFLAGLACTKTRAADSRAAQKPIQAKVVPVELRRIQRPVESVGSLFPFEEVTVSSEVEGPVERVLVDVGDRVVRRQALVRVAPIELELAREQQRAALQQTKARLGLADGGPDVRDPQEAAEVKRAAAELGDAEQKYQRARSLFDEGLIARGTFDEAEARYQAARAGYDLAPWPRPPPARPGAVPAIYPPSAQGEALVLVEITVGPDGTPAAVRVLRGASGFNEAALQAARQWRFRTPAGTTAGRAYIVFGFRQPVALASRVP